MAWYDPTSPQNYNTTDCNPNLPWMETILFCCLQALSGLCSIFGNFIVLLAIYRTRQLQTVSNIFIASLALADFFVGVVLCPIYISIALLKVNLSYHILYEVENFFWIQSLATTAFNLCAVSLDRYFAVNSALRYHEIVTKAKAKLVVLAIWLFSSILGTLIFFMNTTKAKEELFFITQVATVGIPLLIIIYCYYHIFKAARHQSQRTARTDTSSASIHGIEKVKHHKTAITIGIIIGVFVVFFSPNFVFSVLVFITEDFCLKMEYGRNWFWALLLVFLSSAVNPWVYAIRLREFRNAMRAILSKVIRCRFPQEAGSSATLQKRSAIQVKGKN